MHFTVLTFGLLIEFVWSSGNRESGEGMSLCRIAKSVFAEYLENFEENSGPEEFRYLERGCATDECDDYFNYDETNDLNVLQYKFDQDNKENLAVKIPSNCLPSSKSRDRAFTKEWLSSTLYFPPTSSAPLPLKSFLGKRKFDSFERQTRIVFYGPEDQLGFEALHEPSYFAFVNLQPLSDEEDEDLLPRRQSSLIIERLGMRITIDLAEAMFLAAISDPIANHERLTDLLSRKKHLLISADIKAKVINKIMEYLPETGVADGQISWFAFTFIERLEKCGFLQYMDGSNLLRAFTFRPVLDLLIRTNRDIFKQKITLEHLKQLIYTHSDYFLVEMLLMIGIDVNQQTDGMNLLDHLNLANLSCQRFLSNCDLQIPSDFHGDYFQYRKYCGEVETERRELIKMVEDLGVEVSLTLENFEATLNANLLNHQEFYILDQARHLGIELRSETDPSASLLSVCLKTNESGLLDLIMDECLDKLSKVQLEEALLLSNIYCRNNPFFQEWTSQIKARLRNNSEEMEYEE